MSRSLAELTRQITPRTKNGHAPPLEESRSLCKTSIITSYALVRFPVLGQIKPQVPLLVCSSVNSFKFQSCDHTPPRVHKLIIFMSIREETIEVPLSSCGRHLLQWELQRYLIIFDPPTLVLDQQKYRSQQLSLMDNL